MVEAAAQIPVELIPVQLNPAALETKAHARDDQPKEEEAEHEYPAVQGHGVLVTP